MVLFFTILVPLIMIILSLVNSYKIYKKEVKPALSTWIIFLIGTLLSYSTYLFATNFNFFGGILNFADICSALLIIIATLVCVKSKIIFRSFEKWYLIVAIIITVFWVLLKNSYISNLLIQILIWTGYFPTLQKIIHEKINTESYFVWVLALSAGLFSIYPAIHSGSILSYVYVGRSIVMVTTIIIIMYYYDKKNCKKKISFL